jgi:hypothetical protein
LGKRDFLNDNGVSEFRKPLFERVRKDSILRGKFPRGLKILRLNDLETFLKFDNDTILAFNGAPQSSVIFLVLAQKRLNFLSGKVGLNFICDFMLKSVEFLFELLNLSFIHVNDSICFFELALIFRQ